MVLACCGNSRIRDLFNLRLGILLGSGYDIARIHAGFGQTAVWRDEHESGGRNIDAIAGSSSQRPGRGRINLKDFENFDQKYR